MLQDNIQQSDARRLTDTLRSESERSQPYAKNGPVTEVEASLQIVIEGGVLRQRMLANGRFHTVAVYFRDDLINLGLYASSHGRETDYLLALEGTTIGSVPYYAVARLQSTRNGRCDGVGTLISRELGIAQERLVSLGQRSALEAMAHFFLL